MLTLEQITKFCNRYKGSNQHFAIWDNVDGVMEEITLGEIAETLQEITARYNAVVQQQLRSSCVMCDELRKFENGD